MGDRLGKVATIARYWHTLRHLRPVQFYRRIWFRAARPRPALGDAPPLREATGAWVKPARYAASLIDASRFRFLNEGHNLAVIGWDNAAVAKLWRYNQHYFADLIAVDAIERAEWHRQLLTDWLEHNPPGKGTGWEPYPLSLRIVNMIKWVMAGNELPAALIHSLAVQVRWLARRIEWHLLANHLFANGKALLFAGLFFIGPEADRWRRIGIGILSRELDEQILADGAQFELSPMYHALALDDVLDLINVLRRYDDVACGDLMSRLAGKAGPMQRWLGMMCHPDGEIALFNDAAFGIAPTLAELAGYARRLNLADDIVPAGLSAASGYFRLSAGNAVLIGDVARVGPPYQAGHAHADTLSFELSIEGSRVFVNGGTSVYGAGEDRLQQRGTAAHNTVILAARNSSDVWGGFRVGKRARPFDIVVAMHGGISTARGAHDGYRGLPGRPIHAREWRLADGALSIEDEVSNPDLVGEARYHLHPDIVARQAGPLDGTLTTPDGLTMHWRATGSTTTLEDSVWHPQFGVGMRTTCLVVRLDHGRAALELNWT